MIRVYRAHLRERGICAKQARPWFDSHPEMPSWADFVNHGVEASALRAAGADPVHGSAHAIRVADEVEAEASKK